MVEIRGEWGANTRTLGRLHLLSKQILLHLPQFRPMYILLLLPVEGILEVSVVVFNCQGVFD